MKESFIETLRPGQRVDDLFMVRDKQVGHKKNGEPYLTFVLTDRTGVLKAVAWDRVEEILQQLEMGDMAHVEGQVTTYNGSPQVVVQNVAAIKDMNGMDLGDFLPSTDKDVDAMFHRLMEIANGVRHQHLSALLDAFFRDDTFVEKFKAAPAAKKMHHAYRGGLLEHTLSIATLAKSVSTHYKGLNRDLLMTGAVLHDIGKIDEFSYTTTIDYSDAGRLLSHIIIGTDMLEKKIQTIEGFPADVAMLLKHMIVSHHGTREFGSPQPPMTLEAVILNFLDDLDAKVTGVRAFMESESSDSVWTSYHKLMERFFYKGKTDASLDKTDEIHQSKEDS